MLSVLVLLDFDLPRYGARRGLVVDERGLAVSGQNIFISRLQLEIILTSLMWLWYQPENTTRSWKWLSVGIEQFKLLSDEQQKWVKLAGSALVYRRKLKI